MGVLGPVGTHSEAAALYLMAWQRLDCEIVCFGDIGECLHAAEMGAVDAAFVPVENSLEGAIAVTLDTLAHSDTLRVRREVIWPVHNYLMARRADGEIRCVYSHAQPIAQCRDFLLRCCPRAEIIKTASTARAAEIPSIVDSRYDILRYEGIGYVKQNDAELAAALGRELRSEEDIHAAGRELRERLGADGVLITRGAQGMTLFLSDGSATNIPVSDHSEIFDVSGAGDTCVAVMILALAAGVDPLTAARLSNIASGIAVRKRGTATVAQEELRGALAAIEGGC